MEENLEEKHVELLAPAGSLEAFEAAVNAGADAVYLAGSKFGARAYAENFDSETLHQVLRTAHLCGVRINVTVNTLTRQEELPGVLEFLGPLYEDGLDAVIVQDLGVMQMLHREMPDLALHASTQLSVTNADAVQFLARLGVTRVVPARELSLAEIRDLKRELPIEVETFIHGAMCYCYSGKCLFSSFLGGRSGNRGRCAQPCRLPYRILDPEGRRTGEDAARKEYYPLSMRDMQTVQILPELIEAGIDSFKIEGRMKKPEYAAGTVRIYRKYIDLYYRLCKEGRREEYRVEPEDLQELSELYIRSERSEGYYHCYNGRNFVTLGEPGYSGAEEALLTKLRSGYVHPVTGVPVGMDARFAAGERNRLTVRALSSGVSFTAEGEKADTAKNRPMTAEVFEKNLGKTGGTVFVPKCVRADVEGAVFVPVGGINALRREALAGLEQKLLNDYNQKRMYALRKVREEIAKSLSDGGIDEDESKTVRESVGISAGRFDAVPDSDGVLSGIGLIAVVLNEEQADAARRGGADLIIDDSASFSGIGKGEFVALPYAVRGKNHAFMERVLQDLRGGIYRGALVRNIEGLWFLRRGGYRGIILADSSLYCWNRESRKALAGEADAFVYPLELSGRELSETFPGEADSILMVYGRVPMMISAGCVRKTEKLCRGKEEGFYFLEDRMGEHFPVRTVCTQCTNIVYNSVPLSLHRAWSDTLFRRTRAKMLVFTTESAEETAAATALFRDIQDGLMAEEPTYRYTAGHYKKGAL